jgi:hypothetical protein
MRKNFFFLAILLALSLQVCQSWGIHTEHPSYKVVQKIDDQVEIRKYSASKWVQTSVIDRCVNYDKYINGLYMKLYRYRVGINDQSECMRMTVPVLTVFENLNKTNGDKIDYDSVCNISMRFYIPKLNQDNPPIPRSDASLVDEDEFTVAVITRGWYPNIKDYLVSRDLLIERLDEQASNFDTSGLMVANYDPPWRFWCRRNEVWLRKI